MRIALFAIIALFLVWVDGVAQQFPITVIPQINQPAPVHFSNYADATTINSPVRLRLLLNDLTVSNEEIRLKVSFEGNGISFESNDFIIGAAPLFINGGEPLELTNEVLAPYYEFQNIRGINPNTYGATIEEGSYQFCFEVFDAVTGNRLSTKSCRTIYIFRNEPPLLNLPLHKTNIEPTDFENILFQWTPRHINVSNVIYELSIVEVWDDMVDPQTAFLSSIPVFQTTTRSTSFIYGPSEPLLLAGKRYAWRIQAKALQGAEEIGLFRNEGNSEIFWFTRTEPCETPRAVTAQPQGTTKINVFWEENPILYASYVIRYREADQPGAEWFTMNTNSAWATIWHLKPGTTYEYQVAGKCKFAESNFTELQEVTTTTQEDESSNYNCGIVPEEIAIKNRNPHPGLRVGDRVTAGNFVVTLTEIDSQNNGMISGSGFVSVPYLKYARLAVRYEGVLINTDNQLAQGVIVTVTDENFGEGTGMTVDVDIKPIEIFTGDQGEIGTATVDYDIATIEQNENGAWVITGTNGEQGVIPGGQDVVVTDANGDTHSISEDGTITQGEMAPGGPVTANNTDGIGTNGVTEIKDIGITVEFIESGYYGYDKLMDVDNTTFSSYYEKVTVRDKEVPIIYKAVSKLQGEDFINAKVTFDTDQYTRDDLIFKTREGTLVPVKWNENIAKLTLVKTFNYANEDILATVISKEDPEKQVVVGTFRLVHLGAEVTDIEVVIVPVNDVRLENGLERTINEIYNKAGVNFNTAIAPAFQVSGNVWDRNQNGVLDVGESDLLSHYTDDQNAIASAFKASAQYDAKKYYVFVTDVPVSDNTSNGFMPLKRQFGFVFSSRGQGRIAAHELGHGIFGLEHPFATYGTSEGTTDFLMDYSGGTEFSHMDWKKMHAPGLQLYWFQGDEDGASVKLDAVARKSRIEKIIAHIKNRNENKDEMLEWSSMMQKNNGRNGAVTISLEGDQEYLLGLKKARLSLEKYPPGAVDKIKASVGNETLAIKEEKFLKIGEVVNIVYELTIPSSQGDFVFKFDHHDDVETFCNYLQIDRDQVYSSSNESNFSKQIITYLDDNHYPKGVITADSDCDAFEKYFIEIPSDYLKTKNEEKLWAALQSMLGCSANEWGASEEDGIIALVEGLGNFGSDAFLKGLFSREAKQGVNVFKTLYSKVDNWGGADNFTKLMDALFTIWKESTFNKDAIVQDVPYESEKSFGFYASAYDLEFSDDYKTIGIKTRKGIGRGAQTTTEWYDSYGPIRLIKYKNIENPGFEIRQVNIPVFILKAIAQNYKTHNTDRGANFAFETVTTVSGVGNVLKLRHLSKLGKLQKAVYGLDAADAVLSTTNYLLKYSGVCDDPKTDGRKSFCDKLGLFADVVGLAGGFGSLAQRTKELKQRADGLLQEIEKNPEIITNADDLDEIKKGLREIIGGGDIISLRKALDKDFIISNATSYENFKLSLSTVEFLLKHSEDCKDDEVCKETLQFLGMLQKGIKAKDLGTRIVNGARNLSSTVKEKPNAFKDSNSRKSLLEELEVVAFRGMAANYPSLIKALDNSANEGLVKKFSDASFDKKSELIKAWDALEGFPKIQVHNGGKNLEALLIVQDRFSYAGKTSYQGLKKLFEGGASKQKLIDGLTQANNIFPADLPVTFSGIKAGEIVVSFDKNGKGDEVARFIDGTLQKRKIISEEDGSYKSIKKVDDESEMVRKGDEVGFKVKTYKNVSFQEFFNTIYKPKSSDTHLITEAYKLWGQERWKDLEALITTNDLNGKWPPYNGFKSISKVEKGASLKGKLFDRFQMTSVLEGSFASPLLSVSQGINNYVFTHDARALKGAPVKNTHYIVFKIKEDVPVDVEFSYGEAIPWFGYDGNAQQIKSSQKLDALKEHIEVIEMHRYNGTKWEEMKFDGTNWKVVEE